MPVRIELEFSYATEIRMKIWRLSYASATLSEAEANYNQFEKESLASIIAVNKLKYLYRREFVVWTDSVQVQLIFGEHIRLPSTVHPRLLPLAIILSGYTYKNNIYLRG